ncbi:Asp23/Gls24 family envelope stress response protein [Pseudokineococcus basanitobsidens]|uniref:Asp23/Gls24 family envelope stress response protein n=1 Tax=Pseudokineococcus basanitobsidens TaxID=1926649 RepID=A0ABU8RFF8_9ACTN
MSEDAGERLPCGRPVDPLLDLVTRGRAQPPHDDRDEHERACVHCRALVAEAEDVWAPVRSLAARREVPPPDLVESVMAAVRRLGREPLHLVIPGRRGATRVSVDALGRLAEEAAWGVPDVRVVLSRRSRARVDGATAEPTGAAAAVGVPGGPDGGRVLVDLAVVVSHGVSIPRTADLVRAAVRRQLDALASAPDVVVDIYVDDVVV